jgi:hypothetical protein
MHTPCILWVCGFEFTSGNRVKQLRCIAIGI